MPLRSSKKPMQCLRVVSLLNSPLQLRPTALSFMDLEDSPGVVSLHFSFNELSSSNAEFPGSQSTKTLVLMTYGIVTQILADHHLAVLTPSQVGRSTYSDFKRYLRRMHKTNSTP